MEAILGFTTKDTWLARKAMPSSIVPPFEKCKKTPRWQRRVLRLFEHCGITDRRRQPNTVVPYRPDRKKARSHGVVREPAPKRHAVHQEGYQGFRKVGLKPGMRIVD